MKTPETLLLDSLAIADKMHAHLERSQAQIQPLLPMTGDQITNITNAAIDQLDLYLSRFGKLQDYMVSKLFRALARASLEDTSQDVSALDTLNRMAKFGVISDIDQWLQARLLRNAFAHEYLSDNAAIADNINNANALFPLLGETLNNARTFYNSHIARQRT